MSELFFSTYEFVDLLITFENLIVKYNDMFNNIKSVFTHDYNIIIDRINKFKYTKTKFIYDEFNKNLKYIDYALEECLSSEKILMTISNISKYDIALDKMVVTLINGNLQKHIFCISTHINNEICKLFIVNKILTHCCISDILSMNVFKLSREISDEFVIFRVAFGYSYKINVYGKIDFNDISTSSFLFNHIIYMLCKYTNIEDSKKHKYCFDNR
jgi:hypothetical protein